jgi:hypothetical protein
MLSKWFRNASNRIGESAWVNSRSSGDTSNAPTFVARARHANATRRSITLTVHANRAVIDAFILAH